MSLPENINELTLDFNVPTLQSVRLHQYDSNSRKIIVTCTDHGQVINLDNSTVTAKIKWTKPDGLYVYNECEIDSDGNVVIQCTEQMMIAYGKADAEVMLIDKNTDAILHTMPFKAIIQKSSFQNDAVTSTHEFDVLNHIFQEVREVKDIIAQFPEWEAAENTRKANETTRISNENTRKSNETSRVSAENTRKSNENTRISNENARIAAENQRKTNETNRVNAEANRVTEFNEKISAVDSRLTTLDQTIPDLTAALQEAKTYSQSASKSASTATSALSSISSISNTVNTYRKEAKTNAEKAELSMENASKSEDGAAQYAKIAQSYAVGDTDYRQNENVKNAKYYYEQARHISMELNGALLPMGTISFSQLQSQEKQPGYMYNISDDFVSDSTFKDGGDISYIAGTSVYYTADGYWDCLANPYFALTERIAELENILSNFTLLAINEGICLQTNDNKNIVTDTNDEIFVYTKPNS